MDRFVESLRAARAQIERAELVFLRFPYELSRELHALTEDNARTLETSFRELGDVTEVAAAELAGPEDDLSATNALQVATREVLRRMTDETDVVLDVSSLPRVAAVALTTAFLQKLVPDKTNESGLYSDGVNFQVLVAEDATLDRGIHAEDPTNELVLIPGFAGALRTESMLDWPLAWFPILGEGRLSQLEKVMEEIPGDAEVCPVVPHPSSDPRRADQLLLEYRIPLFDSLETPMSNILLVDERNPFEAYRQLLRAMERYRESMGILGGCRLVVTPLGSKLVTVGASLACFEMRPTQVHSKYGVAIPCAAPTRYVATAAALRETRPVISALLLTGAAYR